MKMDKKIAFAVLFAIIFLATPMVSVPQSVVVLTDPAEWYMTVPGVLATDTYKLYPYKATSLNIGFSKFGEFINPRPVGASVGLEYADPTDPRDPFANEGIPMNQWLNGWLINVTYVSSILTPSLRNVWAFAEYADTTEPGVGKDWACGLAHYTAGAGGRQTSGYAETDPINVVYNGPRKFVALLTTHLYDVASGFKFPLVDVVFTIVFDKVEKNVIIYKDIHYRLGPKEGMINVQFSNRGQWDLGPSTAAYYSNARYYHQDLVTCYGAGYLLTPWILRDVYDVISIPAGKYLSELGGTSPTGDFPQLQGTGHLDTDLTYTLGCPTMTPLIAPSTGSKYPAVVETEIVTVSGALQRAGVDYTDVLASNRNTEDYNRKDMWKIKFLHDIAGPATIRIEYKNIMKQLKVWDDDYEWQPYYLSHYYDVAQFISADTPNPKFVGYAAFWPTCSDYTVDGWMTKFVNLWATPGTFSDDVVTVPAEKIPFLIGEWDFMLDPATPQFRGVTNYGIVDWHDADNGAGTEVIDKEAMYQLTEVFMPWEMYYAVHKQDSRWDYEATTAAATHSLSDAKATACKPGLDDKIYYAVVSSERNALFGTGKPADWTGYFFRDEGTYPAESKMLNEFTDSATHGYARSKNWFALIDSTDGQDMLKVTPRVIYKDDVTYYPLTLQLKDLVDFGFWYRMPAGTWLIGPHIEIKVYENPDATGKWQCIGPYMNYKVPPADPNAIYWTHYTLSNIEQFISPGHTADDAFQLIVGGTSGLPEGVFHSWEYWTDTTRLGNYYVQYVGVVAQPGADRDKAYIDDLSVTYKVGISDVRYERVYNLEEDKLIPSDWYAYCSFAERVEVGTEVYKRLKVGTTATAADFIAAGVTKGYTIVFWSSTEKSKLYFWQYDGTSVTSLSVKPKVLYSTIEENEKGRYEWNIVGTYSHPVDSAGAAMISEYFDSKKDISVWMSGLDMAYLPKVPYIFSPTATGYYVDTLGRAHVEDDWCNTVPIESSNIIVVGGPLANLGAYYLNDFTPAFWDYENSQIIALSCWSLNAYRNGYNGPWLFNTRTGAWVRPTSTAAADVGYAVISTYKDKNQTVWFDVWGIDGRDTYYASWAIWNTWLGEKLQQEPWCLTTLIVKFDYSKHPTAACFITIVESLGTISEYNFGKQIQYFDGDSKTVTFQLWWCGIDTSRVAVYIWNTATSAWDLTTAYTINEWGTLIFTTAPPSRADSIKVVYYLKQPPIHPCRPVPGL